MREIKFRAWFKSLKLMRHENFGGSIEDINTILKEFNEKQILMQYTGLKDKNGVEICEGDVLEVYNDKSRFYNDIAKVVFHNGAFMLKSIDFEDEHIELFINHPFSLYGQENYEVIGNIYENKELLK